MISRAAGTFDQWRDSARALLAAGVAPDSVTWIDTRSGQKGLFGDAGPAPPAGEAKEVRVPPRFLELAKSAALHRDSERWPLLYRVLWRLQREKELLNIEIDDDVRRLSLMSKAVGHDIHRMHAFVRFRAVVEQDGTERFVAWHQPDHYIVKAAAPFFARRFAAMHWAILTPDDCVYWDTADLRFGPGVPRSEAPSGDALEDLWRTYYAGVFNPARVNPALLRKELPVRHWSTLPETSEISALIYHAGGRVEQMARSQPASAAPWVPPDHSLPVLAEASKGCRGCDLFRHATQTVFGEGPADARVVLVGEQPGDQEDLQGQPFVGPAGKLLDKALVEAGVDRSRVYVTNAVKHFKFEPRGKRRIHQKPTGVEIKACFPWLEAELTALRPEVVVCLGATAAQALLGRAFRVTQDRGRLLPHQWAKWALATIHPSALLRMPEHDRREREYAQFVEDLRQIRRAEAA